MLNTIIINKELVFKDMIFYRINIKKKDFS